MSEPPPEIKDHPRFRQTYERREEAAAAARAAQTAYRRLMLSFIVSTALAAVVGGLVLYGADASAPASNSAGPADLKGFFSSPNVHLPLRVLQALSVGVAAFAAFALNGRDYAKTWRENREKAEMGRCERARVALEIGHAKDPGAFRAAGDYVVVDMLEEQIAYLSKAIHTRAAGASSMTILSAVILAVAAGAPILASAGLPQLVLFGALTAVVTPALLSGLRSWAEATGDSDRVKLHTATRDFLRNILSRRGEFDAAIAKNDLAAARAYLDEVCAALRTDVEGFLRIMGSVALPTPPTVNSSTTPPKN